MGRYQPSLPDHPRNRPDALAIEPLNGGDNIDQLAKRGHANGCLTDRNPGSMRGGGIEPRDRKGQKGLRENPGKKRLLCRGLFCRILISVEFIDVNGCPDT